MKIKTFSVSFFLALTGLSTIGLNFGGNAWAQSATKKDGYSCRVFNSVSTTGTPLDVFYSDSSDLASVVSACVEVMRALIPSPQRNYEVRYELKLPDGWPSKALQLASATADYEIFNKCTGPFNFSGNTETLGNLEVTLTAHLNKVSGKLAAVSFRALQDKYLTPDGGEMPAVLFDTQKALVSELAWHSLAASFRPTFLLKPGVTLLVSSQYLKEKNELKEIHFETGDGSDDMRMQITFRRPAESNTSQITWNWAPPCYAKNIDLLKSLGRKVQFN